MTKTATSRLRPLLSTPAWTIAGDALTLVRCDDDLANSQPLASLARSGIQLAATRSRLARRALRAEATDAVQISDHVALINHRGAVRLLDVATGDLTVDFSFPKARRALHLARVEGASQDADGVYFGDYMSNMSKQPTSIWHRSARTGRWRSVHNFSAGEVNHIHDVVFDPFRECFWVLSGDFGAAAAIWRASLDWSKVEPLFRGEQQHRATWMFVLPDRIFYATDSQLEANWLMCLTFTGNKLALERIRELPGSSIYGAAADGVFFFSTTVEPGYPAGGRLGSLLTRTPGPGIRDRCAYVYALGQGGGVRDLRAAAKDRWPLNTFQLGTFRLCARSSGGVFVTGQAVDGDDGRTRVLMVESSRSQ